MLKDDVWGLQGQEVVDPAKEDAPLFKVSNPPIPWPTHPRSPSPPAPHTCRSSAGEAQSATSARF